MNDPEVTLARVPEPQPEPEPEPSPFRAFDEAVFVESDAWRRLNAILATNGGAYALSGPRGAGKSWVMQKALAQIETKRELGLWYPCPSNYSPFEFLSTLSDNFANEIERRYRPDRLYPALESAPWRLVAGSLLVVGGFTVGFIMEALIEALRMLGLVCILVGVVATLGWIWTSTVSRSGEPRQSRVARPIEDPEAVKRRQQLAVWGVIAYSTCFALVAGGGAMVAFGVGDGQFEAFQLRQLVLAGVPLLVGYAVLVVTLLGIARERQPEELLTREAALLRERIRYSARRKEGAEVSAKGASAGFGGSLKTSREKDLVERPTTVASLIQDFRALARRAGEVSGRVVIAIDELDKIADPDAVRALLRDVKGIFEIKHVFFLVSVSDEATRSLKLGGVSQRDEFNSSFYALIDIPPMTAEFVTDFFHKRKTDLEPLVASALAFLTGNNPRETLRLADYAIRRSAAADPASAVATAMSVEVRAFRAEAMQSSAPGWPRGLSEDERVRLTRELAISRFAPREFRAAAVALWDEWTPDWGGEYWNAHLLDQWRRLVIRLYVAPKLLDGKPEPAKLETVLEALAESPIAAREMLQNTVK